MLYSRVYNCVRYYTRYQQIACVSKNCIQCWNMFCDQNISYADLKNNNAQWNLSSCKKGGLNRDAKNIKFIICQYWISLNFLVQIYTHIRLLCTYGCTVFLCNYSSRYTSLQDLYQFWVMAPRYGYEYEWVHINRMKRCRGGSNSDDLCRAAPSTKTLIRK